MRRAFALLLLAVFSFPLIAPAMFVDADSNLPECCRRGGKHHCAMSDSAAAPAGVSIRASQPRCPMYPGALSTPAGGLIAVLNSPSAIFGAIVSHPAIHAQTEAGYRVSLGRSSQKRGPPIVLS